MTERMAGGSSPRHPASPSTRRRSWPHRVVALALILAGAGVTAYPVVETVTTNSVLSSEAVAYSAAVAKAGPRPRAAQLVRAQQYNQRLAPQVLLDPWGDTLPNPTATHNEYLSQLNGFAAMARLRVPKINVDLPVFHDATRAQLAKGVGHMYGTALPVGSVGTNPVLAAHTGWRTATMFDRLTEVTAGDRFYVDVYGETLTYQVDSIRMVEPDDVRAVAPVPGADHVTLLTCEERPDDHTRRLLVRGVRVHTTAPVPTTNRTTNTVTTSLTETVTQDWMLLRLGGAGGALALASVMVVAWVVSDRRRRR